MKPESADGARVADAIFCATSSARAGLVSASPIQSTCGCRAATSPRKSPTRPAPMMASPMRFAVFRMDASRAGLNPL